MKIKQKILKFIADLRFAICILLLISFFSIIGTIIEQDQSIETYKSQYPLNQPFFGFLTWDIILFFGLDHIYKTVWFCSLITIFGFSLISCTFLQQIPSVRIARRCQFFRTIEPFNKLKLSITLTQQTFSRLMERLKFNNYSVFHQKNLLYCYKGLIGRIAPIFVHFSMLLILGGTLISSFEGFKSQEIIPETENFHIQNIFTSGQFTRVPNISARINDFWITYTQQNTIKQFYSDISILNQNGIEIKRETSNVNYPIIFDNVYFYQTDWNLTGIRLLDENKEFIEYPLLNILNNQSKIWLTWFSLNSNITDGIIGIIDNLQGYCSMYNNQGFFLGNLELNEKNLALNQLQLVDIVGSTGLQIKKDPGIFTIYIGFLFLMLSTILSYVTYSQIWLIQRSNKFLIGGTTTRALFEFEFEFFNVIK